MALSTELAEKVAATYRERLAREFDYHPVFDPITVEPATYYASEEVLKSPSSTRATSTPSTPTRPSES